LEGEKSGYCTQLAYCETHRLQLWASIVEKGLAKACGCYTALHLGSASEALGMLTGWPCTKVSLDRKDFDPDILWVTLCSSKQADFLMTCGTDRTHASSGLQPFHIYSLMDAQEVKVSGGQQLRLVKVRNPHANAKTKWQGAWSEKSSTWTDEARREVGYPTAGIPGVFFMSFTDFLKNFGHCTICKIRSNEWHEVRQPIRLHSSSVPSTGLGLQPDDTSECMLSLTQPEERLRRGPLYRDHSLPIANIGFALLDVSGPRPTVVASAGMRDRSTVSVECWLQRGHEYLFVPLSRRHRSPVRAALACFSSRAVAIKQQAIEGDVASLVQSALLRSRGPAPTD